MALAGSLPAPPADPPAELDAVALLDALPDMVLILDDAGCIVYGNQMCRTTLGWGDERLGQHALEFVHPDDVDVVATSMQTIRGKPLGTPVELRVADASGAWHWVELIGADRRHVAGIDGVVCVARDITQRRMWEIAGGDLARFQQVVQHAGSMTVLLDAQGAITSINNAFNRLLGFDKSVALGRPLAAFATSESSPVLADSVRRCIATGAPAVVEVFMRRADRDVPRPMRFEIRNLLSDPVVDGLVVTGHDISDLHHAQRRLEYLASHDTLTGLANRALLIARMEQLVGAQRPMAILFIDLNGFKPVNDALGHEAGDELLRRVGQRLGFATRPGDLIARIGGDEFVVVAPDVTDLAHAQSMAARAERALVEPFQLGGGAVRISASAGAAVSNRTSTVSGLLARADAAMYLSKRTRIPSSTPCASCPIARSADPAA